MTANVNYLTLPVWLGGLEIINPTKLCSLQYNASLNITQFLCDLILKQSTTYPLSFKLAQQNAKKTSSAARPLAEKDSHTHLLSTFPPRLRRILEASSEKGSRSWLTALPLPSHGFALHKGDFRDALCLRFGWQPSLLCIWCGMLCSK